MKKIALKIKRKENTQDIPLPKYMSIGSSGMDLYADTQGEVSLNPQEVKLISAGYI